VSRGVSLETLYNYLDYITRANLISKVERYDVRGKRILVGKYKYYLTDLGFTNILSEGKREQMGAYLENIVYNELLYKGYEVYIGKTKTGEVDFIARKDGQTRYIQVTYEMNNEGTRERKFNAFNGINESYPKYIISLDDKDYSKGGIINLNLIDFLMKNEF